MPLIIERLRLAGRAFGGHNLARARSAGALKLKVHESPWNMTFFDSDGNPVLVELPAIVDGPSGSLGLHLGPPPAGNRQQPSLPPIQSQAPVPSVPPARASGWVHAVSVESSEVAGGSYSAVLSTSDRERKLELRAEVEADGVI